MIDKKVLFITGAAIGIGHGGTVSNLASEGYGYRFQ